MAAAIGQDWFEFDLRNAQLAIAARLWNVPAVDELLQSARSVWDVLLPELMEAVNRRAEEAGIRTTLGLTHDPREHGCNELARRATLAP